MRKRSEAVKKEGPTDITAGLYEKEKEFRKCL